MSNNSIVDDLEADLRSSPENYTNDLHSEMEKLAERIETEMGIERDAIEKDEEMLEKVRRMLKLYGRYEHDLNTFVTFLKKAPDRWNQVTAGVKFSQMVEDPETDVDISNNPAEVTQAIQTIEEDFKEVESELKAKDSELKQVLEHDYEMEKEIELVEKMSEILEKISGSFAEETERLSK